MARTKKTTAATAETVKEVVAAPAEEKKPAAKKTAAPAEEKKPTVKKTAAPKTAAKTTAKKTAEISENVFIQQNGSEVTAAALIAKAKADAGVKSPKKVDVYVRPEINMVYYVIDGDKFGSFELC